MEPATVVVISVSLRVWIKEGIVIKRLVLITNDIAVGIIRRTTSSMATDIG